MEIKIKNEKNNVASFIDAIEKCRNANEPCVLSLEKGEYHFYEADAIKKKYYISNTLADSENPDKTKHIGILFDGVKNITLDGNGSTFIYHGRMTQIVFDKAENITVKNLFTDFNAPTVSEMTLVRKTDEYCDFEVNQDSEYEIHEGHLIWICDGFQHAGNLVQYCKKSEGITKRAGPNLMNFKVEQMDGFIRVHGYKTDLEVGDVYQERNTLRTEVGFFALDSKNITMENVTAYFMHGLGFVGQFSENITFDGFKAIPNKAHGRTNSCFADSIHISGCKGLITVRNGEFDGTQDDILNVHGTTLKTTEIVSDKIITVRFGHDQSYGFEAFRKGDEIAFVNNKTLIHIEKGVIEKAELISEYEMRLTFEKPIPKNFVIGNTIENLTWQPGLIFENNIIRNDPTRGILITTSKKCIVRNNRFEKTFMSAILVAADANSWFESGHVEDLEIYGNEFEKCAEPVILIAPEVQENGGIIHKNIYIHDNKFRMIGGMYLKAKNVDNLKSKNNTFDIQVLASIKDCTNVNLE